MRIGRKVGKGMLKKVLKRLGIGVLALLSLVVIAVSVGLFSFSHMLENSMVGMKVDQTAENKESI